MTVGVYSLQKVLFEGEASEVNCKTKMGEITILNHHEPLIAVLAEGTMKIVHHGDKEEYIVVKSGFLEVNAGNKVKILIEEGKA
jgi:F-type H+-transporting ATPase subunit epsilon